MTEKRLSRSEKIDRCNVFMSKLASILGSSYEMIRSCNQDISLYLIPVGTKEELSYYGKPDKSFRFSDHWNWYSSLRCCQDETLVQCHSLDIPWTRKRIEPEKATEPRYGIQVSLYDSATKCYRHVYGDKFDRKTKTWTWIESNAAEVITNGIS